MHITKDRNHLWLRISSRILAFLGIFLGFSNTIHAQYGVIESEFIIQGNLISADCHENIDGLKVSLKVKSPYQTEPVLVSQEQLSSDGKFQLMVWDSFINGDFLVFVSDPDGPASGHFRDTVFVLPVEQLAIKQVAGGHWNRQMTNTFVPVLEMKRNGVTPCPTEMPLIPDTSQMIVAGETDTVVTELPQTNLTELPPPDTDSAKSSMTAVTEAAALELKIFPNPNKGPFTLEFVSAETGQALINIYDAVMRKIFWSECQIRTGLNQQTFDLSAFPAGTYFFEFVTTQGRSILKVIKD
jgi:hypothetical protein